MEVDPQPPGTEPSHRDEVRESMRDSVLGLLSQKPFKDLKIDEIASAAGLTRTGFYFYFKNKTEVLVAVVEEMAADLYQEADRWWSGGDEDQQNALHEALQGTAEVFERHAAVLRAAMEVTSYDADFAALYRQLVERFVTSAAQHIRDEQAAGRARAIEPDPIAEALVWMTERCCFELICLDGRPTQGVVAALLPIWSRAIYPDSGPGE